MGKERTTHIDWHYDKCCEAWCALWESKRRITNTQERGVADMVRRRVNNRIKEEYKKAYAEKKLNEEAAIERAGKEQQGKPAVNKCRAELLGEDGNGSRQKSRTPKPEYMNRVAVVKGYAPSQPEPLLHIGIGPEQVRFGVADFDAAVALVREQLFKVAAP